MRITGSMHRGCSRGMKGTVVAGPEKERPADFRLGDRRLRLSRRCATGSKDAKRTAFWGYGAALGLLLISPADVSGFPGEFSSFKQCL